MNKFFSVVKKEFFKNIKRPSFWILTFGIPILYVLIFGITIFSNKQAEKISIERNEGIKKIFIFDESNIIKNQKNEKINFVNDYKTGFESFLGEKENIFIHYKKDFLYTNKIDLYVNSSEIIDSYTLIVDNITKESIFEKIRDKDLVLSYSKGFNTNISKYNNGELISDLEDKTIIAGVGSIIFFIMILFGNNFMLTSLTQEKENRTLEIIISSLKASTFINGKIFGGLLVLIFQLFVFLFFPLIFVFVFKNSIPSYVFDFIYSVKIIDFISIFFFILSGFLIFAGVMVSAGSIGNNTKQAANLATPFILLACLPLYLSTSIISNPTGLLSLIFSYIPFTGPMVLLYRNGVGGLYDIEKIIGPLIIIFYVFLSLYLARKFFEIGAIEYNRKIKFLDIFKKK